MTHVSLQTFRTTAKYFCLALLLCAVQQAISPTSYAKHPSSSKHRGGKPTAKAVPIKGVLHANEVSVAQFPILFVDGEGAGRASHLGRFAVTYEYEVDLLTLVGTGPAHYIAANGDSLFTEVTGQGYATDNPDVSFIVETQTIVGGTGRFEDATGEFTVHRLLNTATGFSVGKFRGKIVKH